MMKKLFCILVFCFLLCGCKTQNDELKSYSSIDEYYNSLTLEEKIGQLFLVMAPESKRREIVLEYPIGGYVYSTPHVVNHTKESLKEEMNSLRKITSVPLFFAIDEEGGDVTRLSYNKEIVPEFLESPKDIYVKSGMNGIINDTIYKSKLLEELGFSMNLAPVADVTSDESSFMYKRSFGSDALEVGNFIETVIKTSKDYKVSYVLKHFPGHGNYDDTHIKRIVSDKTIEEYEKKDLIPFKMGIDAGAKVIMLDHIIMKAFDEDNPVSLSKNVIDYLKNKMGYKGLILSDCLSMIADEDKYVKAISAGNDMLLIRDYREASLELLNAYIDKRLSDEVLEYHVKKILNWKKDMGLFKIGD